MILFLLKDNPSFKEIGVGAPSRRNVSMVWPDNPKNCVTKEQEPVKGGLESDLRSFNVPSEPSFGWKLIFLFKKNYTKNFQVNVRNFEANRPRGTCVMTSKNTQANRDYYFRYIYIYRYFLLLPIEWKPTSGSFRRCIVR